MPGCIYTNCEIVEYEGFTSHGVRWRGKRFKEINNNSHSDSSTHYYRATVAGRFVGTRQAALANDTLDACQIFLALYDALTDPTVGKGYCKDS